MTNTNSVVISGRACQNAKVTTISDKCTKYAFSIACNRSYKKGDEWVEETNFFDVEAINKHIFEKELKGQFMIIEGHLQQDRWEKDGQKFSKVKVIVDNVEFIFSGNKDNETPATAPSSNNSKSVEIPF